MTKPVVSVVFRAFNCERYIGQAIESILAQTFQDFEIVVVDDASTDGTEAIPRTYAQRDQRIRIFRNETNLGPVRTMNNVLRRARGEFIAVHDADDISLPHRLETQVNFLRANPQIALVGGGAYLIDKEGEELKVDPPRRQGPEEVRQQLEKSCNIVHTSVMYRRACIEAIGLYDEFFAYSHDYDMLIRMADAFDIVYYEEPLVRFRWMTSGVTATKSQAQAAYAELARTRRKAKKDGVFLDLEQEYRRLMAKGNITGGIDRDWPPSEARYCYMVGTMLLKKGEPQKARKKFLQVFRQKGRFDIFPRAIVFYLLSFLPNSYNSKVVQTLRKAI